MTEAAANVKNQNIPRFHFLETLIATVIIVSIVLSAGYFYAAHSLTNSTHFLPDIIINDVNVGGLTFDEARDILLVNENNELNSKGFSIICEDKTLTLKSGDYITSDLERVLQKAFNSSKSDDSLVKKMGALLSSYSKGETTYTSSFNIDEASLKKSVHSFAQQFYSAPTLPAIEFDSAGNSFSFSKEGVGRYVDEGELFNKALNQFKSLVTTDISISVLPLMPKETAQTLKETIQSIAVSKIDDISDNSYQCNANIELLINRIHGKVILSGETFSMGNFLSENLKPGELSEEPDSLRENGIDQFAGLFYYAALLSDMDVVKREQQPYPSKHLQYGLDALVDATHDLVVTNTSEYPMYISALKNGNSVKIEVFGAVFKYNQTLRIEYESLETIAPPAPIIVSDPSLQPGEIVPIVEEVSGYRINTFRRYFINNEYDHQVLISSDVYQPIQGEYRQG